MSFDISKYTPFQKFGMLWGEKIGRPFSIEEWQKAMEGMFNESYSLSEALAKKIKENK